MLPDHIKSAIDEYSPKLGDWLGLERAYEMAEMILERKPKVCVEIGTFKGNSMLVQAFALRENNDGGKLYCIDPWSVADATEGNNDPENNKWWSSAISLNQVHQECMEAIWQHHLEPWVVVIRAASQYCHELFRHDIDWIYIDGSHAEVPSCRDVENYVPRVKPGGTVLFDDAGWATTQKALGLIETMCSLEKDGGHYRIYRKR